MSGFVGFTGNHQVSDRQMVIEAMNKRIRHRGRDGEGYFKDDRLVLGSRRLATIDLEAGKQPFASTDQRYLIVSDGSIYNHKSLRDDLAKKGHQFRTQSDTEILLYSYIEWGTDMFSHLRGAFAFVIYDKETGELFGARDHFGTKPLYYSEIEGELVFASEIKAILEYPGYSKEVNLEALESYLSFQYSPLAESFFKGIFRLPVGHYFRYNDQKFEIHQYFEASFEPEEDMTLEEAKKLIDGALNEAVDLHGQSDVKVGSLLSSGIDSSLIVALAKPEDTFTVGFEKKYNEIPYAEGLAKAVGVDNHSEIISAEDYWAMQPYIQYYMDEPLGDAAASALYFVQRLASQKVKVVYSGEGADELFGGYTIYHEPYSLAGYQKLPKSFRKVLGKFAEKAIPEGVKGRSYLIRGSQDLEERFIGNANRFSVAERKKVLKEPTNAPTPQELTAPYYEANRHLSQTTQMQLIDINFWMAGDINLKGDRMSAANGVEVRMPLLDQKVYEVARRIPVKWRIAEGTTKYALREVAKKYIPEISATKEKLGFPVPIGVWLREEKYYHEVYTAFTSSEAAKFFVVEEIVSLLNDHYQGRRDNSKKIWVIFMFLNWYRVYFTEPMTYEALDQIEK